MVAARVQKRCAVHNSNPLCQTGVLQRVLSYVGPGHWIFLSTVSSLWREWYSRVADRTIQTRQFEFGDCIETADFTCVPQMTLFSSIFASPARVRLVHARGLDITTTSFGRAAGRYADVPVLEAAHELGMQYTVETLQGAAMCNQLSVLQYLRTQGCPWNRSVPDAAAGAGAYEKLRWLREQGCEWCDDGILRQAASSGNIEMTAWVKQQPGIKCDDGVMFRAASLGLTAMCEYLHSEQCPWDTTVCDGAARQGHVDTVRWLQDNGCPWTAERVCAAAAAGGRIGVMTYLLQQSTTATPAMLTHMLSVAGCYSELVAAQWLRQQGAEWPARLRYLRPWAGDVLAWARAEGCTSPT
jgi:hypothetical protein